MVTVDHPIVDNIHRVIARVATPLARTENERWFGAGNELRIKFTDLKTGATIVNDFAFSVPSKIDIYFDGVKIPFTNGLSVTGLQSIYARLEGTILGNTKEVLIDFSAETAGSVVRCAVSEV